MARQIRRKRSLGPRRGGGCCSERRGVNAEEAEIARANPSVGLTNCLTVGPKALSNNLYCNDEIDTRGPIRRTDAAFNVFRAQRSFEALRVCSQSCAASSLPYPSSMHLRDHPLALALAITLWVAYSSSEVSVSTASTQAPRMLVMPKPLRCGVESYCYLSPRRSCRTRR